MDNCMFEFVPEPATVALTVFGAAGVVAVLRRRRS
ncbi:MAG TPA: PEP-CTERM sorting domain-containing protein [Verrucomicrobiae bacterium]|nr:PEP-CTERM sorting domain-containing protein [Verrucomicrobiae bacterium]